MSSDRNRCATCGIDLGKRACFRGGKGTGPGFCPTLNHPDLRDAALAAYHTPETNAFFVASSVIEKEVQPRLLETVSLCRRMGYQKIGLAFCAGLRNEARAVEGFFTRKGLTVVSVICKVGHLTRQEVVADDGADTKPQSVMCNPILQARVLNAARTEFNVVLGLCVGHDSLFLKESDALSTVLAVKDRRLAHNPLGAVYTLDTFYRYLEKE